MAKPTTKGQLRKQIELAILGLTRVSAGVVTALGFLLGGGGLSESIAWLESLLLCIGLLAIKDEVHAGECFSKLYFEAKAEGPVRGLVQKVIDAIEGGAPMPAVCSPTHSSKVQGPGVCCAAFAAAGFSATNPPAIGTRVAAQTVATATSPSKCIVCEIKASRSVKTPGKPVIGRGKSLGLCPSNTHGCCAIGI